MKKVILCFALLLALSGCGTKTLSCKLSQTEESTGYIYEAIVEMKFKDDELVDGEQTIIITCSDEASAEVLKAYLESTNEDIVIKISGAKLTITTDNGEVLVENFSLYTYDELKETLEESGYTCK